MALTAGNHLQSNNTVSTPDLISAFVQQYLTENAVLIPTILDRSSEAGNNGSVDYLKFNSGLEAETKTEEGAYTAQRFVVDKDTLTFDKQKGVFVKASTKSQIQTTLPVEINVLERSADALVQQLEADVYAELRKAQAANRKKLGTKDTLSLADIFNARKVMNKLFIPMASRYLAINPDQETDVLKLENFIHAEKYGTSNNTVLKNGEIGRIAGFTVVVSNNVAESEVIAYHRDHVVFGRQYNITWEKDRDLQYSMTQYLLETLYGLKVLDSGKKGVLINNLGAL